MDQFIENVGALLENKKTLEAILPSIFTSGAAILNTIFTIFIAVIGFKRSLINEINKHKSNKQLEKLQEIPEKILKCVELIVTDEIDLVTTEPDETGSKLCRKLEYIISMITCYGSKNSLKLAGELYQLVLNMETKYKNLDDKVLNLNDEVKIISFLVLLICQIKLDLTNEIMEPNLYYRCIMDQYSEEYAKYYKEMASINNYLVKKIKLNKLFIINVKQDISYDIQKIVNTKLELVS